MDKPGVQFRTKQKITWCPGCPDHIILESARRTLISLVEQGYNKNNFAMAAGIGCHGKIFDYLNISGIYALHGRAIPTAIGMKMGNPNLELLVFSGDGDTYAEGMAHFIHACRFNPDLTLFVNDNQSFSLTTGQATPTSQPGFKSNLEPLGNFNSPLNPIHLALSAGASFVARCNANDIEHTRMVMEAAIKHKGFSFVEILQDCIVFNLYVNNKDRLMYKLKETKRSLAQALVLSQEYDYVNNKGRIPLGIFYAAPRPTLDGEWPQLVNLKNKKVGWGGLKK